MAKYTKVDDLRKATENKMAKAVRAGAIVCFQNIIIGSPVDTGRFRVNWQVSINTPKSSVLNPGETRKDAQGKPIKNQFTGTADVIGGTNGYTLKDAMYLTNNLPYAQRLADGYSAQRGSGWIDVEVQNAEKAVEAALGAL